MTRTNLVSCKLFRLRELAVGSDGGCPFMDGCCRNGRRSAVAGVVPSDTGNSSWPAFGATYKKSKSCALLAGAAMTRRCE